MPTFYVQNFGCRASQADGAAIEHQFEERGLERALTSGSAAIVVLNTCTVTAAADQDARAAIRRVHRENPQARIVVTGCYAQRSPEQLANLPGVSQVVGNSHKHQLAGIALGNFNLRPTEAVPNFVSVTRLTKAWSSSQRAHLAGAELSEASIDRRPIWVSDIFAHTQFLASPVFDAPNERTRPNLKVQDGCDNRCSFCVIPFVRGQNRSLKLEDILREVNTLVAAGYRELVISGINLGRWGRDLDEVVSSQVSGFIKPGDLSGRGTRFNPRPFLARPELSEGTDDRQLVFSDLIRAIVDHTSLEKLRISSVEPMDWSDDLIHLVAQSSRIAKHAHVPMQSGSDAVLRRMHRKYRPWHYREKIEKIRAAMPTAAIGADVMVGFPGETDAEFEETRQMIEDLPFTYMHVFTFSPRPGTPAATMPKQISPAVMRERNRTLRDLAAGKKLQFMRSFVGKTLQAITLAGDFVAATNGTATVTEALSDNYLPVQLHGKYPANHWMKVQVEGLREGVLFASPC